MQNFKELKVWGKAHAFALRIYGATERFPKQEMFGITSQLRRAATSVAANIAEGCGRKSKGDLGRFLNIALGSANESEYFLILAKDLTYLKEKEFDELSLLINEIKAMLISFISKVHASP